MVELSLILILRAALILKQVIMFTIPLIGDSLEQEYTVNPVLVLPVNMPLMLEPKMILGGNMQEPMRLLKN